MKSKLFDTNILVYAYDASEGQKHEKASHMIREVWERGNGVISVQNLMEFFVVITGKVEHPVEVSVAGTIVEDFLDSDVWQVLGRNANVLKTTLDLVREYDLHFWDAAIAATMLENDVHRIVTEDQKDFAPIPGIEAIEPF